MTQPRDLGTLLRSTGRQHFFTVENYSTIPTDFVIRRDQVVYCSETRLVYAGDGVSEFSTLTGIGGTSTGASANNRIGVDSAHLPKTTQALARVRGGYGDAKFLFIGDSTTEGNGTDLGVTYPHRGAWPNRAAQALTSFGIPCAAGAGVPIYSTNSDVRWTKGAGWGAAAYGVGPAGTYSGTAPAGTLDYADPTVNADKFDVYYLSNTGLGTITATATGGTPVVQSCNAATATRKITVTAAVAATTNNITISATGAAVYIVAIEPWLSTQSKIRFANVAQGGTRVDQWTPVGVTGFNIQAFLNLYQPDAVFINHGINDGAAAITTAAYLTGLNTLITWAATAGADVIFLTPNFVSTAYEPTFMAGYRTAIRTSLTPYALFDSALRFRSYAQANALGFMSDTLHPSSLGHTDIGQFVAGGILSL